MATPTVLVDFISLAILYVMFILLGKLLLLILNLFLCIVESNGRQFLCIVECNGLLIHFVIFSSCSLVSFQFMVEDLTIRNYQGTRFPSWIGHYSFSHIVSLYLVNCRYCYWMPSLGQLPSLRSLEICGLDMVERIGDEFYYCSSSIGDEFYYCSSSTSTGSSSMITPPPFTSLQSLSLNRLCELREWKECSLMGGGNGREEGAGAFSQLKSLQLRECPKINGDYFPCHLPSSTTLTISQGCQQLVASLQSHQLTWMGELELYYCSEMVSFPPQGGLRSNIHTIHIRVCDKLVSLAKHGWPSNLKLLHIYYCENLFADVDSFPEEGQLPTTLTCLKLEYLQNLKSLNGKALRNLICLEQLSIEMCIKLQCLPEEGLPDSLSELNIIWCNSLSKRCKRDAGKHWPKIAHISRINIAGDSFA